MILVTDRVRVVTLVTVIKGGGGDIGDSDKRWEW